MRRAASPPRGEARPQKRICPPQTRSPHSDLSQPPLEVWCAEKVNPHFSSVWQLGDASVFPPSTVRPFATRGPRVRGHSRFSPTAYGPRAGYLSVQLFTLHQPKQGRRGRHCIQAFSTLQLRYVFLCMTLCFLYRISFTNGSVYQGYHFGFSALFGPATHFSLGEISPASTEFR